MKNSIISYKVIFAYREGEEGENEKRMNRFIDMYKDLFIPYSDCWRDKCYYLKNNKHEMCEGYYTSHMSGEAILTFKMSKENFEMVKKTIDIKKVKGKWRDCHSLYNGYVVT